MKERIFYQDGDPNKKLKCGCLCKNRTPEWLECLDDLEYVGCEDFSKERVAEQLSLFR
jgi:hypothetical protein